MIAGCSQESNNSNKRGWYETKEEAIEHGLKDEEVNRDDILSIQEIKGESIVFYEHNGGLGVASITKTEKGYSWFRNRPYTDYDSDAPFLVGGFEFETESGSVIPILAGKAFDRNIEKMLLIENNTKKDLGIHEKSRLFFSIHSLPFSSLEVIPIEKP